jgi:hypothetical protein
VSARLLLLHYIFVRVDFPSSPNPKSLEVNPIIAQDSFFPPVCIDKGHFLVKNSFSSFAISTQKMAVTFPAHKVMH